MDSDASVSIIMTQSVLAVSPDTSIAAVARIMVEEGVSGLPVVSGRGIVGIITEIDVVSKEIDVDPPAYGTFLDAVFRFPWDRTNDEVRRVVALTAGELMSSPVRTIDPQASIHEAADMMFKEGVSPIPVVNTDGEMVGIVSRTDIVRLIAQAGDTSETP